MVIALMALALFTAHALGRWLGVPDKLSTLIGVGTAVCGNTAISAVSPVIRAKDEETSFAIATNTLFGTLAVFAYPLIGHAVGMSPAAFGTWAGTAVNDTSQVVATGFAYGVDAGKGGHRGQAHAQHDDGRRDHPDGRDVLRPQPRKRQIALAAREALRPPLRARISHHVRVEHASRRVVGFRIRSGAISRWMHRRRRNSWCSLRWRGSD